MERIFYVVQNSDARSARDELISCTRDGRAIDFYPALASFVDRDRERWGLNETTFAIHRGELGACLIDIIGKYA